MRLISACRCAGRAESSFTVTGTNLRQIHYRKVDAMPSQITSNFVCALPVILCFQMLLAPLWGKIVGSVGNRCGHWIGAACFGLGFMLCSFATSMSMMYAIFSVPGDPLFCSVFFLLKCQLSSISANNSVGIGNGLMFVDTQQIVPTWFRRKVTCHLLQLRVDELFCLICKRKCECTSAWTGPRHI